MEIDGRPRRGDAVDPRIVHRELLRDALRDPLAEPTGDYEPAPRRRDIRTLRDIDAYEEQQ